MYLLLALTLALFSPVTQACENHACSSETCAGKKAEKPRFLASAKPAKNASPEAFEGKSYGKGVTLNSPPISLTEALEKKNELGGKDILVKAEVAQVCQSKGCWMMLKDGDKQVRVTFSNYSFFVPKDSANQDALVQGKIFEKKISAAEARHYAKDAGMPAEEVKKIKEGSTSPWFEATGLSLKNKATL